MGPKVVGEPAVFIFPRVSFLGAAPGIPEIMFSGEPAWTAFEFRIVCHPWKKAEPPTRKGSGNPNQTLFEVFEHNKMGPYDIYDICNWSYNP